MRNKNIIALTPKQQSTFDELYRKYSSSIYRQAVAKSDNEQDAEEITQEVFLALAKELMKGTILFAPKNWLAKVLKTQVKNFYFRQGVSVKSSCPIDTLGEIVSYEDGFETAELEVPDYLDENDRQLLSYEVYGYSRDETAKLLGISPVACRTRYSRLHAKIAIRAKVKKLLK